MVELRPTVSLDAVPGASGVGRLGSRGGRTSLTGPVTAGDCPASSSSCCRSASPSCRSGLNGMPQHFHRSSVESAPQRGHFTSGTLNRGLLDSVGRITSSESFVASTAAPIGFSVGLLESSRTLAVDAGYGRPFRIRWAGLDRRVSALPRTSLRALLRLNFSWSTFWRIGPNLDRLL